MANLKLWTTPSQQQGHVIRACAAYGGVELELLEGFEFGKTNKTEEFLSKFPLGKIPALEVGGSFFLYESAAIIRYISSLAKNSTLTGSTPEEVALIDQWMSVTEHEIKSYAYGVASVIKAQSFPYSKQAETTWKERLERSLIFVEAHLQKNTFLATERITMADITLAGTLKWCFEFIIDEPMRAKYPNLKRFYETVSLNPKIQPAFGETKYCEKAMQYTPPAKQPKKEKEAPVAAAPKPKAKEVVKEDDDDDEDDALKEEPKAKNPLDALPKSTFNLEDWKRAYSNMETRGAGGSLEWLYSKFDKEGFSIWRCDFKYNEELDVIFKSSNQIGGFFNRLEASRKYLFGSMGVLGEPNNSVISGVFICRGHDYKPVMDVAPDWESYDYKQINLDDPADKAYLEGAMAWDLEIDGKKWADGKNFK